MKSTTKKILAIVVGLALLALAACSEPDLQSSSTPEPVPPLIVESTPHSSNAATPESQSEAMKAKTTNPDLAEALELLATEQQTLVLGCDKSENSGGSLVVQSKDDLLALISETLSQINFEQLTLEQQPPYSRYLRVSYEEDYNDWRLTLLEEHDDSQATPPTFLSLFKWGYPEPVFFPLSREVFDALYSAVNEKVAMPEPPKEEFIKPLKDLIEAYKNATIEKNEYQQRYEDFPAGEPFPEIQTVDDFEVEPGNEMVNYHVVIPLGDGSKWEMIVGMNFMYPQAHLPQIPEWNATLAAFRPAKVESVSPTVTSSASIAAGIKNTSSESEATEPPRQLFFDGYEAIVELFTVLEKDDKYIEEYLTNHNFDMNGLTARGDIQALLTTLSGINVPVIENGSNPKIVIYPDSSLMTVWHESDSGVKYDFSISTEPDSAPQRIGALKEKGQLSKEISAENFEVYSVINNADKSSAIVFAADIDGTFMLVRVFKAGDTTTALNGLMTFEYSKTPLQFHQKQK